MKVKGGGKRKVLNDAVEGNAENENQENSQYQSIDVTDEHGENQEQQKEKENDEEENNEEENEDEEDEVEDGEATQDEAREERTKLDDGFFEIEAIRRRRVRKGQLQYLIKWRGWPETANTWEPLENLQSCSDVIDAFEESLCSGKSSRKRKRKGGGSNSLLKKKQPHLSAYNVTGVVGQSLSADPFINTSLFDLPTSTQSIGSGHEGENDRNVNNVKTAKYTSENRLANGSKQIDGRNKELEYDPKLSELKGMISFNEVNADKLALHFQEARVSDGNCLTHGLSKVDQVELVHGDRCTGARRRKSGSVKRFKQDLASSKQVVTQDSTASIGVGCNGIDEQLGMVNSNHKSKNEGSRNVSTIVKILKPIDFSTTVSDEMQDVAVTFMAVRSDGKEVMVDNKYLKANNPLLLINFYERHLKYSTQ